MWLYPRERKPVLLRGIGRADNRNRRRRLNRYGMSPLRKAGLLVFAVAMAPLSGTRSAQTSKATRALQEAGAMCRADNGALWGISLCGPLLLVDPVTRLVVANQSGQEGQLKGNGDSFVGKLPERINIANTAVDWAGTRWTMIMLPLPEEKHRRAALLGHEMWHRIQEELGIPLSAATNNHLDTRDGRYWLQLEWRALATALSTKGPAQKEAEADAVLFRARRRQIFPEAANTEREMELSEGLAEYTGVKLSGNPDPARFVIDVELKEAPAKETFVRSFAYATGPAYGLLLDETGAEWRRAARAHRDLAELLLERAGIKSPDKIEAAANDRAKKYRSAELAASEDKREEARRDLVKNYRTRFVDGPVLILPLQKMNMQFDPGNLMPLDSLGTVYPNIRIVDNWGILIVARGGALMSADFTRVTLPAPKNITAPSIKGDGWELQLNSGWSVGPGERQGDFTIRPGR